MSEAMTVELIVEAEWALRNYWTKLRFPIQPRRNWSDVDVLAYSPEDKHLVIAESKVQGGKNDLFAGADGLGRYYVRTLIDDLDHCCTSGVIFRDFAAAVDRLTVQLVSNWAVPADQRQAIAGDVHSAACAKVPLDGDKVDVMLDTTLETFARVVKAERACKQGRRHGHPVLDIARELNRYRCPSVEEVGQVKADLDAVKQSAFAPFIEALGLDAHDAPT